MTSYNINLLKRFHNCRPDLIYNFPVQKLTSIPQLDFNDLIFDFVVLNSEFNAYSCGRVRFEFVAHESREQIRFADAGFANKNYFEEHVVRNIFWYLCFGRELKTSNVRPHPLKNNSFSKQINFICKENYPYGYNTIIFEYYALDNLRTRVLVEQSPTWCGCRATGQRVVSLSAFRPCTIDLRYRCLLHCPEARLLCPKT